MAKRKPASTTKKSASQALVPVVMPPEFAGPIVPAATAQTQTIVSNTKEDVVAVAVVTLEQELDKQYDQKAVEHITLTNLQADIEQRLDKQVDKEGQAFAEANGQELLSAVARITKQAYQIRSTTEFDRDAMMLNVTIIIEDPKADHYRRSGNSVHLEADVPASVELHRLMEAWVKAGDAVDKAQKELLVIRNKKSNMYKYSKRLSAKLTVASLQGTEEGRAMLNSVMDNLHSVIDEDSQDSLLLLTQQ